METLWNDLVAERAKLPIEEWPYGCDPTQVVVKLIKIGNPQAWQRPTHWRGKTQTPARTLRAENVLGIYMLEDLEKRGAQKADGLHSFGIRCRFFYDFHRRDGDRMENTVLDACRGIIFADDDQVYESWWTKFPGSSVPRTELLIYRLGPLVRPKTR